jgi:DHA2 family multidrug resistance protein
MTFSNIAWASLVQGLGVGLTWPPVSVICFATLSNKYHGEATAMFHLIRNIGSSFFISVSVAIVLHMGQVNFEEIGSMVTIWNQGINFNNLEKSLDALSVTKLTNELNRQSLMVGYIDAFKVYSWVGFLSIPLIFLIRIKKEN